MKVLKLIFISLLFFFVSSESWSQNHDTIFINQFLPAHCGTPSCSEERREYLIDLYAKELSELEEWKVFHIQAHIIKDLNGVSRINDSILIEAIESLNKSFHSAHIRFELNPEIFYQNSNYVLDDLRKNLSIEIKITDKNWIREVINLYIVQSTNQLQGYTPILQKDFDRLDEYELNKIFIADRALGNGATLQHEMGHFFNLHHTHGNSPLEATTKELPDGSNCLTTGDLICDTPSDPNGQLDCCTCEYMGTINPQPYEFNPLVNNFMSYYKYCCKNAFTPGQLLMMRKSAIYHRAYLK